MTFRNVTVVVHITEECKGTYAIDETDYLDWLNGDEDTPSRIREYLRSVYDEAEKNSAIEIWDSQIEEVLA